MNEQAAGERQDGAVYFGQEVRFAREHKGLTQQQLADEARYERPYVTRVEGGSLLASEQFAAVCDRVFSTPGYFVRLRRRVSERGHPGWFVPYVKLEREAIDICDYSNAFIMGMLQTRKYAEAIFRAAHPRETDEQINARVDARMLRYAVMARQKPPLLWVILHESVLRTEVGGRTVMAEQLNYLCDEAASPHVAIQVLPFRAGAPASNLPFILLTTAEGAPVLYTDNVDGGRMNDSAVMVDDARAQYDRLRAAACSAQESLSLIRGIAKEFAT